MTSGMLAVKSYRELYMQTVYEFCQCSCSHWALADCICFHNGAGGVHVPPVALVRDGYWHRCYDKLNKKWELTRQCKQVGNNPDERESACQYPSCCQCAANARWRQKSVWVWGAHRFKWGLCAGFSAAALEEHLPRVWAHGKCGQVPA